MYLSGASSGQVDAGFAVIFNRLKWLLHSCSHRIRPPSTPLPSKTFRNYIHPFSFAIAYNSTGLPCYQPGIQPGPNSWAVGCSLNACDLRWQSIRKLAIRTTVKQLTQPRAWNATTDIRRYEYSLDSGFNMLQFHATGRFASIPA